MRRAAGFLVVLLIGLGLLTAIGYIALTRMTQGWFESDLALRSRLAVASARQSLDESWESDRLVLRGVLADITRDEQIVGAAACTHAGDLLASTEGFPFEFRCQAVLQDAGWSKDGRSDFWAHTYDVPGGRYYVSATALEPSTSVNRGVVLLLHDLSFLSRREEATRVMVIGAFFVLSLGASVITLIMARLAWRAWTSDLTRALVGQGSSDFQPLVQDVRTLIDRLAHERVSAGRAGPWNPERLRSTLRQHLQGERVVLLANREPYIHEQTADGLQVQHPASGLVTALEPVMRACSGVWIAHGSGSGDRAASDAHGRVRVPPGEESYLLRRVWLTPEEEKGYYYGLANEGLWPLCHLAHTRPIFRAEDWAHYVRVNERFADAVCEEVDTDDPIVLVQDYHFALAPRMIRDRLPRATILTFWHIPWPNAERFGICPWRDEIISGLLGSSIAGFHTQQHCNNFIDSVEMYMESRVDREDQAVVQNKRRTLVRPYPISIEWPVHWLDDIPDVGECRAAVHEELGLDASMLVGVGVDRLDYTKGIEERFRAVDTLLERYPEFRGRFVFVQLAAPSRTEIERYRELNTQVEAVAREINARWGVGSYQPIILLRAHHEPTTVYRYYRAAELCYVSSLHDGMNLVAKEYVAARNDLQGVLLLSQFTGAARELPEALIVNPYDLEEASDALALALRMPPDEQRERMNAMRRLVSEFNVYQWAGRMLVDAAELRRRERVTGRLTAAHIGQRPYLR